MSQLSASIEEIKNIVESMQDRDLQMRIHQILNAAKTFESKLHAIKAWAIAKKQHEILTIIEN